MKNKAFHLPGLDGIRALASLAVLFSHTTLALPQFGLSNEKGEGFLLAGFGVSVFFALSGFLITFLLLREGIHNFSVKNFYIRRVLRIWPLYYLYLFIFIIIAYYFKIEDINGQLFFYFLLSANIPLITNTAINYIGHYWSIGVEEQFYIFWPWLIKKAKQRLPIYIVTIILIMIGAKFLLKFSFENYDSHVIYRAIHITRFHCMLIGALGAYWYFTSNTLFLKVSSSKLVQFTCWLVMALVAINKFHIASIIDNEIICVITVFIIVGQITEANFTISLNNRLLNAIGRISYGIYVIHPLVILLLSQMLFTLEIQPLSKLILVYLSVLILTLGLAWVCYNFYEKYFLALKEKFT